MNKTLPKNSLPILFLPFVCLLFSLLGSAQTLAPGAPGKDANWATAGKQGVGTSATLESKVWFTLAQGVMTEVYYPDVTVANVHLLQFVVVDPKTRKIETEQDDAIHSLISETEYYGGTPLTNAQKTQFETMGSVKDGPKLDPQSSLQFIQQNIAKSGKWKIRKRYLTDVENNTVLIRVFFESTDKNLELYVFYDPSLDNSGMHDTGWTQGTALVAQDKGKSSALLIGEGRNAERFADLSHGFYQVSDGLEQLRRDGKISKPYEQAENGNVVQIAKIVSSDRKFSNFTLALGFGNTPENAVQAAGNSLKKGFDDSYRQFVGGWNDYVKTLRRVDPKYQAQFNMAAMLLKAHEDKTVRGANIASLTIPWGGDKNANENTVGGYHLIWSRDLYQVATAFMALGDRDAANRALDFLFNVQQKPDGSFPQNSFLDGKPFWGSLQLDEVAYPLILSYQLQRFDKATYANHVRKAADFLVKTGPKTPQERWEEKSGYSPSTIAAEIAGLVCAAYIARRNGDEEAATLYLATADEWARNVEKWTVTTNGKYGDGNYYVRLTENGTPDAREKTELNNGAGTFIENEIVDAGFLELVRLGIKAPDDPLIVKSLKVIDEQLKVETPNGAGFYRYNHDGYGEMDDGRRWNWDGKYTGKGRLWALLSGERGQYELALAKSSRPDETQNPQSKIQNQEFLTKAKTRLDAMLGFANDGLMIPEQVWDRAQTPSADRQFVPELKFGENTGSATPLAWSMAQFIRLAVNLTEGRNLDTPDIVYNRYVLGKKDLGQLDSPVGGRGYLQNLPNGKSFSEILKVQSPQITECQKKPGSASCDDSKQMRACIVYTGNFKKLEIAGDFTGWKPKKLKVEKKADKTEIECLTFAKSARTEYKLVVDGRWIIDPLNPNRIDNGVGGENSVLEMPEYQPTSWNNSAGMTEPVIQSLRVSSKIYGEREVKVYLPEGLQNEALPVLYLQDGSDYLKRAEAVSIQRNLVKAGKIKPFIMVFIDYKDRMKEYWASDAYARFLATEIVPAVDANYKTIKSREARAVLGASLGGVTSIWAGLRYPEVFARIGGQSSSFWIDRWRVVKELEKLDAGKASYRFYFDDGTLEGVEDTRRVNDLLRGKGYPVTYIEGETGHNWTSWRDRLAEAFVALMN